MFEGFGAFPLPVLGLATVVGGGIITGIAL